MPRVHKPVAKEEERLFSEAMEQALEALEDYLGAVAENRSRGVREQERARAARAAVASARGEWWKTGMEVRALHQRVAHLESEVARLERFVGKLSNALDESEWVTGA